MSSKPVWARCLTLVKLLQGRSGSTSSVLPCSEVCDHHGLVNHAKELPERLR
jgi:hypothetical protein